MLPESLPANTFEDIALRRFTSRLTYLVRVADEEPLLVGRYLQRDDNCMTRVHHRVTGSAPQGLER